MKKTLPLRNLLLYYSTAASMFLSLSGFMSVKEVDNAPLQLMFLPITMYLFLTTSNNMKSYLLNKKRHVVHTEKGKSKGLIIIGFSFLYFALLFFGLLSVNNAREKPKSTTGSSQESSTPLIFKKKDSETKYIQIRSGLEEKIPIKVSPSSLVETYRFVEKGEKFELIKDLDGWYEVKLKDGRGYLDKQFTEISAQ